MKYRLWLSIAITIGLIVCFIIGNALRNSGGENIESEGEQPAGEVIQ